MKNMRALLIAVGLLLSLVTVPVFAQDASASPEASASAAPAAPAEPAPAVPSAENQFMGKGAKPDAQVAAIFGNTSWVLVSAALVFFMTIPGLALFYGGLVKKKNILSIIMQSLGAMAIVSVLWVTVVYSLAFGGGPIMDDKGVVTGTKDLIPGILGNFDMAFLKGVTTGSASFYITQPNAPVFDLSFVMFQAMFAVITPALIIGAFAERLKFGHFVGFIIAWMIFVYAPVAHSVWSAGGWLFQAGALDFAGGTVVHINAGVAGLVAALVLGKRNKLKPNPPHNLVFTVMGAAMLWFGWFGFNAGSALAADGIASSAFMTTNTATAMAAIVWFVLDWIFNKKPTVLGAASGAVAGLVAITPAAGFVNVSGALIIGAVAATLCYLMVVFVKGKLGYDDSLDCFGVHGIGGLTGALLVGLLADPNIWQGYGHGPADPAPFAGGAAQFLIQLKAVGFTILWTGVGSFIIFGIIKLLKGKASDTEQAVGLDIVEHNERAYTVIE